MLIAYGAHDLITSTRFGEPLSGGIASSEVVVFGRLSHPGLRENVEALNPATLDVLLLQGLGPGLALTPDPPRRLEPQSDGRRHAD